MGALFDITRESTGGGLTAWRSGCFCTRELLPVCDTVSRKQFPNECTAKCQVRLACVGLCGGVCVPLLGSIERAPPPQPPATMSCLDPTPTAASPTPPPPSLPSSSVQGIESTTPCGALPRMVDVTIVAQSGEVRLPFVLLVFLLLHWVYILGVHQGHKRQNEPMPLWGGHVLSAALLRPLLTRLRRGCIVALHCCGLPCRQHPGGEPQRLPSQLPASSSTSSPCHGPHVPTPSIFSHIHPAFSAHRTSRPCPPRPCMSTLMTSGRCAAAPVTHSSPVCSQPAAPRSLATATTTTITMTPMRTRQLLSRWVLRGVGGRGVENRGLGCRRARAGGRGSADGHISCRWQVNTSLPPRTPPLPCAHIPSTNAHHSCHAHAQAVGVAMTEVVLLATETIIPEPAATAASDAIVRALSAALGVSKADGAPDAAATAAAAPATATLGLRMPEMPLVEQAFNISATPSGAARFSGSLKRAAAPADAAAASAPAPSGPAGIFVRDPARISSIMSSLLLPIPVAAPFINNINLRSSAAAATALTAATTPTAAAAPAAAVGSIAEAAREALLPTAAPAGTLAAAAGEMLAAAPGSSYLQAAVADVLSTLDAVDAGMGVRAADGAAALRQALTGLSAAVMSAMSGAPGAAVGAAPAFRMGANATRAMANATMEAADWLGDAIILPANATGSSNSSDMPVAAVVEAVVAPVAQPDSESEFESEVVALDGDYPELYASEYEFGNRKLLRWKA